MQSKMSSSQFFDAVREGRLMGLQCTTCQEYTCPPRMVCQECGSEDVELVELSRRGVIRTFTVSYVAARCFPTPYVLAMVETDEGPWLMGNITAVAPDQVSEDLVGRRVEIEWTEVNGDEYSDGPGVALDFVPLE